MQILGYVFDVLLPALFAYLATSDTVIDFLKAKNILSASLDIALFKDVCLIINILLSVVVLNIKIIRRDCKIKKHKKRIDGLYDMVSTTIQNCFEQISHNSNFNFELRIFVRDRNILVPLTKVLRHDKGSFFSIKNIYPFAKHDQTDNLRIRVNPDPQGLVGRCYTLKTIVYDDDLKTHNETYGLDEAQMLKTSSLRWCICVPILNNNNDVIAVVSFDSSTSNLSITDNINDIRHLVSTYSLMLYNSVPELFEPKVVCIW